MTDERRAKLELLLKAHHMPGGAHQWIAVEALSNDEQRVYFQELENDAERAKWIASMLNDDPSPKGTVASVLREAFPGTRPETTDAAAKAVVDRLKRRGYRILAADEPTSTVSEEEAQQRAYFEELRQLQSGPSQADLMHREEAKRISDEYLAARRERD